MSIVPVNAALCMSLYDHFCLRADRGIVRKGRADARDRIFYNRICDIWIYSIITAFQEHGLCRCSSPVIDLEALIKEVVRHALI